MPSSILTRQPPPPAKNPFLTSDRKATIGLINLVTEKIFYHSLPQVREERSTQQTERLLPVLERRNGEPSSFSNVRSTWRRYWRNARRVRFSTCGFQVLVKCQTQQYRVVEEYKADVQNIVHNVVIYHGVHSKMADCARLMFRDCAIDLTEMVTCRDCYR